MQELNMITAYKINSNGFLEDSKEIDPKEGIDLGWVFDAPPVEIQEGHSHKWVAGKWVAEIEPEASTSVNHNMAENTARKTRNELLIASDWTQGKDIPDSISSPWAEYRQALRDISIQETFPLTITWPEKPAN
jgi:hypothetical protein